MKRGVFVIFYSAIIYETLFSDLTIRICRIKINKNFINQYVRIEQQIAYSLDKLHGHTGRDPANELLAKK
jgi:hypothetical protein